MSANELARRTAAVSRIDFAKVPEALGAVINVQEWASAILTKTPYHEPNPEFISTMIAFNTITARSVEDVFAQQGVDGLQRILADVPGATTGPIEITDLYVAASDYEVGQPCFVIVTAVHTDTGNETKFTTGATNVQATILGLLINGMWPIVCQIKRGDSKDKGGRHLLFVLPPD